ncbi:NmrA domain-containing protein [Mycena sanguinolenta]|uniref:NmrA domain-containing protein n=1 Tax=Mycena sanguinolenta TaxID=230812 RepID=A0A8H7D3Q2_9AGAR|nr:NmrA domain-containing protein [Mycena sanguinolenta]
MTSPRIVSVFGATGLQGGSLVEALLKDGTFVPRAISRDPESEASKKLKARGVEVVKGDPLDKDGLVTALRGSEAVFAVTHPVFFHQNMEGKGELVQGRNIVDAAKEAGVKFFIWSSLPSISKVSGGKYTHAVQYDEKEAVREYLESSGMTHASILLPGFLENLYSRPLMKKTDAGFDIAFPIFKPSDLNSYAWIGRDLPAAALVLLNNYTDPAKGINGKTYPLVNATISCAKLSEMAGKVLGAEVTYTTLPAMGLAPMDEMFMATAEHNGLYAATPIPNPDLVALGMKFSTVEEFMQVELKPRFVQ